jgi:hypothetical protein
MRIRRVRNGDEFLAVLTAADSDALPVWFSDAERDWIARTVNSELSLLPVGMEQSFSSIGLSCGAGDWVLAPPSGIEMLLAKRYATITDRPLALAQPTDIRTVFPNQMPGSVTWFCPLDECDISRALHTLSSSFIATFGKMPPLGVLTAENASKLAWLLIKQLLPRVNESAGVTTMVSMEPMEHAALRSSLTHVCGTDPVAKVLAGINGAAGILLINAHSRPHCGVIKAMDGEVGICGWTTGGTDGRCVDGTDCYFGEGPRAVLQDLQAPRIFFNGCTTAGIGGRRLDFLPRSAMVSHAALRGAAREFIGNVWVGQYEEADIDWFLAVSGLGYSPAQCVEVVEAARKRVDREAVRSLLYFGDATNPAWPVRGVSIGELVIDDGGVRVRWPQVDRVLVARLPGRRIANLAESDRLHAGTLPASNSKIAILPDPFHDASLVLVLPCFDNEQPLDKIEVGFAQLPEPIDRSVGLTLELTVQLLRFLESLPVFAAVLNQASKELEGELILLRQAAASRLHVTMLPELFKYLRQREREAAWRFDTTLIDQALLQSQGTWNWQKEYGHRVKVSPRGQPSSCPNCGAAANDADCTDWANPNVRRTIKTCGYCGIVSDLPVWNLTLSIIPESLVCSMTELRCTAGISNGDDCARRIRLGIAVLRAGEMQPNSISKAELTVDAGQTSVVAFTLLPVKPMHEIMQTRIYIASEGAFGFVGMNLLYGAERSTPVRT